MCLPVFYLSLEINVNLNGFIINYIILITNNLIKINHHKYVELATLLTLLICILSLLIYGYWVSMFFNLLFNLRI